MPAARPDHLLTIRSTAATLLLALLALAALAGPAFAETGTDPKTAPGGVTTSTTLERGSDLPGTTLEAEERDDGNTTAAPWVIGSGLAAVVSIAIGGAVLKRRQD